MAGSVETIELREFEIINCNCRGTSYVQMVNSFIRHIGKLNLSKNNIFCIFWECHSQGRNCTTTHIFRYNRPFSFILAYITYTLALLLWLVWQTKNVIQVVNHFFFFFFDQFQHANRKLIFNIKCKTDRSVANQTIDKNNEKPQYFLTSAEGKNGKC